MNRDATIVQVAILLIIIAIIGVAILKQQRGGPTLSTQSGTITPVQEADVGQDTTDALTDTNDVRDTVIDNTPNIVDVAARPTTPTELLTSNNANLVKQYFGFVAEKDYASACDIISGLKCNASKPAAIENFSTEFKKLAHGYEYVNIKDYGFTAPSGKDIVCVKYTYRYKDDPQPGLVSEIMSFYVDEIGGELKITDRVCEKKYKEGRGLRNCPIEAAADFCEGWVK